MKDFSCSIKELKQFRSNCLKAIKDKQLFSSLSLLEILAKFQSQSFFEFLQKLLVWSVLT